MGRFVNPNDSAFRNALNAEIYVDKTGLLELTNRFLCSPQAFMCNSRPRRFGKSMAANMLAAYYSKGCDSHELFAGLQITKSADYEKYLNKFDVIHFDVQWCFKEVGSAEQTVSFITQTVLAELRDIYGDIIPADVTKVSGALSYINAATGNKFVIIIDEWDVLIRDEATNKAVQEEYIDFLRNLFKGVEPTKFIALAYMTGILPIKKYKTQSALNNFDEYTMLAPGLMAPYNDENSLSSVLTIAFLGTLEYYFKPVREMPTGRGFADFVYLPKPEYSEDYPALVVELKWNRSAQTALQQIREKHYTESLAEYAGDVLLIGINYDKKTKEHSCDIEKLVK